MNLESLYINCCGVHQILVVVSIGTSINPLLLLKSWSQGWPPLEPSSCCAAALKTCCLGHKAALELAVVLPNHWNLAPKADHRLRHWNHWQKKKKKKTNKGPWNKILTLATWLEEDQPILATWVWSELQKKKKKEKKKKKKQPEQKNSFNYETHLARGFIPIHTAT